MKKYLLIALISLSIEIKAHVEHYSKFNYLEYELFRNNKLIGYHKYEFIRSKKIVVNNEVSFKITKLGVDLYKYYAKGTEKYTNGILQPLIQKQIKQKRNMLIFLLIRVTKT